MITVGYGTQPQFQIDVEHPVSWLVVGTEVSPDGNFSTETTGEKKFTLGVDSQITKAATPTIAGGETYVFTMPPVTEGFWKVSYRTNFGTCVTNAGQFIVELPDNSQLVNLP